MVFSVRMYRTSFIIQWNILKLNLKQTIQRIIIILMPIEPETLQGFFFHTPQMVNVSTLADTADN